MKYISLLVLFIVTFLGTWQVYRWNYKTQIILRLQDPPKHLPNKTTKSLEYTKVYSNFNIINGNLIYVYSGKNGFSVLVPGMTDDKRIILLNIGTTAKKDSFIIGGNKILEGNIVFNIKKALMITNYDSKSDTWFGIDIQEISHKTGLKLEPYIIWVEESNIPGVRNNGKIKIYNRHLEYIVTWYGLAIILATYLIYQKIKK